MQQKNFGCIPSALFLLLYLKSTELECTLFYLPVYFVFLTIAELAQKKKEERS